MGTQALTRLREFAARPIAVERCDLCGQPVGSDHDHLIDPSEHRLMCACASCTVLFSGGTTRRRVPRRVRELADFRLSDGRWEALRLPINLAYFVDSTPLGRVTAYYPSPAGATESLLSLEAWRDIVRENPALESMESDVEALLVNRTGHTPEYFLAPIDQCYRLVGLIRTRWRGLSGGLDVWKEIASFFVDLRHRA